MANTSKTEKIGRRDVAYYRQRQRNRVFTALAKFFAEEAAAGKITKKELATKLAKDPSQITRLLSAPSNLELDTISDYLLAMGAEMDHSIVRFVDRAKPNFAHPAVAPHMNIVSPKTSSPSITGTDPLPRVKVRIEQKPDVTSVNRALTTSG
jgi:hypothetical protein